jgi:hypothetical protein
MRCVIAPDERPRPVIAELDGARLDPLVGGRHLADRHLAVVAATDRKVALTHDAPPDE